MKNKVDNGYHLSYKKYVKHYENYKSVLAN